MPALHRRNFTALAIVVGLQALAPRASARTPDDATLARALRAGGHVILIRHGATFTDQADTDPLHLDNVAAQRQLNEKGKALAMAFGEALRAVGIPVGKVYASKFHRAYATATLAGFTDIETTVDLTLGQLVITVDEEGRRAQALRAMLGAPPGTNTLLITHKPNILEALGKDWWDVREAKRRSSAPRTASTCWSRACRWRTGPASPRPRRNDLVRLGRKRHAQLCAGHRRLCRVARRTWSAGT